MTNMEEDDEALIGRYARGDAAAFDQLYRRYEVRVWRYLELNVCHQATSDDLLQEIWFALARNAASLESVKRFRTRLFTLAHDRMTHSLRGRPAKANPATAAGRPAVAHDPANELAQAIGQLPREQREAYLLQTEGQLSPGDIAEITESTVDTVQSRLHLIESDPVYGRLSALDPGRPGEWVRRKVQAYAAQQAAERAVRAIAKAKEISSSEAPTPSAIAIPTAATQTANKPWLLPVIFGAIAAAAVVGFLVVPHLMTPRDRPKAALSPAPVSQPEMTTPPVAQASTPQSSESVSPEPPAPPSELPASALPATPPPVPQSPATATLARTPVAPPSATPPAPVVASRTAGTPPAQPPIRPRIARQSAALQSPPIASERAATTTHAAQPALSAESASAPKVPIAPSTDTQIASAPPPEATPSAAEPAPMPAVSSKPPDEMWLAAKRGDLGRLQAVLAGNVDVNALDAKGQTALIIAIQNNHLDIVRALLAHGANPNTADSRGFTPLRAARIRGNYAIVAALESNGRH